MARTFSKAVLLLTTVGSALSITCPGFPGYCSESFPGQTCVVVCSKGRNNVPLCQEDGTWTDVPRCVEHEPGVDEQIPGICPGISGYCSEGYLGQKCNFDCTTGPDIDSTCTADGTWLPYPTCQGDLRDSQDGCNPCPGPAGAPRNRPLESALGITRPKPVSPSVDRKVRPTFAGAQAFGVLTPQQKQTQQQQQQQQQQRQQQQSFASIQSQFQPQPQSQPRAQFQPQPQSQPRAQFQPQPQPQPRARPQPQAQQPQFQPQSQFQSHQQFPQAQPKAQPQPQQSSFFQPQQQRQPSFQPEPVQPQPVPAQQPRSFQPQPQRPEPVQQPRSFQSQPPQRQSVQPRPVQPQPVQNSFNPSRARQPVSEPARQPQPANARPLSEGRFIVGAGGQIRTEIRDQQQQSRPNEPAEPQISLLPEERVIIQNSIPSAVAPKHQSDQGSFGPFEVFDLNNQPQEPVQGGRRLPVFDAIPGNADFAPGNPEPQLGQEQGFGPFETINLQG